MAMLITVEDQEKELTPPPGGFVLDELRKAIGGGYLELIRVPVELEHAGKLLVVDEDGRQKRLPVNRIASQIAGQPIVGDVVLCDGDEID